MSLKVMEAQHNEALRKEKVIERKECKKTNRRSQERKSLSYFEKVKSPTVLPCKSIIFVYRTNIALQNPGAGPLLGCTTIYMDSYHRARCSSAKLPRRYNVRLFVVCATCNDVPSFSRFSQWLTCSSIDNSDYLLELYTWSHCIIRNFRGFFNFIYKQ